MRIVAAVTSSVEVMRILHSLGLVGVPPSFHDARPPPQGELPFEDAAPGFHPDPPPPRRRRLLIPIAVLVVTPHRHAVVRTDPGQKSLPSSVPLTDGRISKSSSAGRTPEAFTVTSSSSTFPVDATWPKVSSRPCKGPGATRARTPARRERHKAARATRGASCQLVWNQPAVQRKTWREVWTRHTTRV
jgi:hypothetical protein